jgi:hypothetical protein
MKIDLNSIDRENFTVIEQTIAGDRCFLVIPKKHYHDWEKHNLIFRSSIWNEQGEPVSLSFRKFFNWDEKPSLTYTPFSLVANGGCNIVEKKDGSTLICSNYKGNLIVRTRGTFNAETIDNGFEIPILKEKYSKFFNEMSSLNGCMYSYLFEWVTPTNKIVLPVSEPDIYLIGGINHLNYTLLPQIELDQFAKLYDFKRPKHFHFDSIKEMIDLITPMKDIEGVCIYCNKDQDIRKLKTDFYVKLHRAITKDFASFENIVEFYFANEMPDTYQKFYNAVITYSDFEVANHIQGDISRITDAMKEVRHTVNTYKAYALDLQNRKLPRKQVAEEIFQKWSKESNRSGILFALYDNKPLNSDDYKKLFYQIIKYA